MLIWHGVEAANFSPYVIFTCMVIKFFLWAGNIAQSVFHTCFLDFGLDHQHTHITSLSWWPAWAIKVVQWIKALATQAWQSEFTPQNPHGRDNQLPKVVLRPPQKCHSTCVHTRLKHRFEKQVSGKHWPASLVPSVSLRHQREPALENRLAVVEDARKRPWALHLHTSGQGCTYMQKRVCY